jgi:hypothetical protein
MPKASTVGTDKAAPEPALLSKDPFIRRMIALGIPVSRANYLNIVAPGANPDDLDAELEVSLPDELRLSVDDDE